MSQPAIEILHKRYERKYTPEVLTAPQAKNIIRSSQGFFKPLYHPRYINNIYLDTIRFDHYYDNVTGRSERKKIRIRWYGDLLQHNASPLLEIKIKSAHLGDKIQFVLPHCDIATILHSHSAMQTFLQQAELPETISNMLKTLHPRLLNMYKRTYFIDTTGNFRMTVDEGIRYQGLRDNFNRIIRPISLNKRPVIELKYDEKFDDEASRITENIPFRLTKNSKYVNGIERFFNVVY
ncbi:MAG: polyphosphate polymerase domain-containing protein [Bacteroidales bacterium]